MNIRILNYIISGLNSVSTHWSQTSNALGVGNEIILKGGYTLQMYNDSVSLITTLLTQQSVLDGNVETAYGVRNELRTRLVDNSRLLIDTLRVYEGELGEVSALPRKPNQGMKQLALYQTFTVVGEIWQTVKDNPPADFQGELVFCGYGIDDFTADFTAMKAADSAIIEKRFHSKAMRIQRNTKLQDEIYPRIKDYQVRVAGVFAPGTMLRDNLPAVFKRSGVKPVAVTLSGGWDQDKQLASLNWTANSQAELSHYEIRACEGTYRTDRDYHVATVTKEKLSYLTTEGLVEDGSRLSYKVYVITEGGRERGSNTLLVERPEVQELAA